ncbi:Oxidoreductase FAD/NAD(P)-binding protein [Lasiodiplodia theobromae]|nr:Oxidoreductase FAD/NAD(P)-binding protein [Lasiodiplodia theobromae]
MDVTSSPRQHAVPTTETSHPNDPIPHEPASITKFNAPRNVPSNSSFRSSHDSLSWSDSSDSEAPSTPNTEPMNDQQAEELVDKLENLPAPSVEITPKPDKARRASTTLISEDAEGMRKLLGDGETGTKLIEKYCCGGGCCFVKTLPPDTAGPNFTPVVLPDNEAFRSLNLKLGPLSLDTKLEQTPELPHETVSFDIAPATEHKHVAEVLKKPPPFVQPHPPYNVFSAPVHHARELTKPGAQKRTFHFDIDVTDYPDEGGVDFKVGGAIGICPPNPPEMVDDVFDQLGVPKFVRDKPTLLKTKLMRWPTIWGDEMERELVTTRRELLTWCADLQSTPPTKQLLRLMAEYAEAPNEKQILLYLTSAQGQAAFCDLRTGSHITVPQLLHAFPSSRPSLHALLSVLPQLMPRFYSLSNDPHISSARPGIPGGRRLIEMAVTIHEDPDWREGKTRTGLGSGFLERIAQQFIEAEQSGIRDPAHVLDLTVPMFRGLMANPLSRQFGGDGPMMLVGAGVGMAPFRGFILNRLKNANCANKIWLVQGVRDAMLDEIYQGELGAHEREIKKVVQSRKVGSARYVQDEVRMQADVVWFVINALDGRIFVCGSSKGMGEGVHRALVDVAMEKGNLNHDEAEEFWEKKKEGGQYVAETW